MATFETRETKHGTMIRAKIRVKGYPTYSGTFKKLTDARIWANGLESELKRGKKLKDAEAMKHTLGELIDWYIAQKLPERKTNKKSFEAQILWWKDKIGVYRLCDVTPNLLAKTRDDLKKEPNGRATKTKDAYKSNSTVNRYIAALSIVLTKAYKELGWIEENPILKIDKCKEPKERTRFLTKEEQKALLDACDKSSTPLLKLLVTLALSTGARHNELASLTWNNVKFNKENKQVTLYLMNTKNTEHRSVTIDNVGYELLLKHSKIRKINSKYIFARPDGLKPYDLRTQWENALKEAKIENFRFHDLRHTTASNLAMNGASLRDIAEILGHKTMQMTKRYSHLTEKYSTKVLSEMNNKQFDFSDITEKNKG